VLKLTYKPNSQDNPEDENQVEALLIKHKLKYVAQPNGPQNSPDFHVYYKDIVISLEKKSAKKGFPIYNSGLPKEGVVYIFSSKKYNATTIYFSDDVLSKEMRDAYEDLLKALDEVVEKFKMQPVVQKCARGFSFYMRAMFNQAGKWNRTDYFKHADRERCEQNVLNHSW
jgi:hypothetical protein